MTLIEIKPHRWGWKVFEAPGVEPIFPKKDHAMAAIITECSPFEILLRSKNLVDRAVRERDDEEISVRSSVNVGADAEVSSKQQAFTLGDVELEQVVGDAIFQSWIINRDLTAVAGEIEPEQISSQEGGPRRAENHVTLILRPEGAAADESKPRRCDFKLPAKVRVAVVRAGQHHHPRPRLLGRVGDVRRWPPRLLQVAAEHRRLDQLELVDPREWPHHLDPAAVHPRLDQAQLGERVVAVLLQPGVAAHRIEVESEAVAETVGKHLVDIGGDLRVLLDLPPDLAAGQPAGVEVDVRQASEDVRQLGGKGGVVALVAVPLAEDRATDAGGERGYYNVVGVGVVERLAEEAEADTRVRPTWGRGMDVGGQQVVARVGGLRARKIEAGNSDDEPQCRLLLIQEERRVALGRRGVRWVLLAPLEPCHEHVPDSREGVVGGRCPVGV